MSVQWKNSVENYLFTLLATLRRLYTRRLIQININLIALYHERNSLIGYDAHYLSVIDSEKPRCVPFLTKPRQLLSVFEVFLKRISIQF